MQPGDATDWTPERQGLQQHPAQQLVDLLATELAIAQPAQDHGLREIEPALDRGHEQRRADLFARRVVEDGGERDELVDPAPAPSLDQLLYARLPTAGVDHGEVAGGVLVDEAEEV